MAMVNVVPNTNGDGWRIDGPEVGSSETTYQTQEDAMQAARDLLNQHGGGELVVHGEDGKIRSKDTIGKADPRETSG